MVVADQQEHGRGRGTKLFSSPAGGLYMSVILRPDLFPERLPFITLAAGIACASAIEEQSGLTIALKWPNDLYLQGRKLGGILAQTGPYSPASSANTFVILGIGINVNTRRETFAPELRNTVTSLYDVKPELYVTESLLNAIHSQLCALLPVLRDDVAAVVNAWRSRDYLLGRKISWQDARGRTMVGRGAGISSEGSYLLQDAEGTQHVILAGEVRICPTGEQQK